MGKRVDTLFQTAAAAFFMFLIGGVPAIAQQEAPSEAQATPESQGPTFTDTVEVNVVSVYATVVDKKGNPVTGLTADDFVIEEAGNPMEITNFYAVGTVQTGVSGGASSAPAMGEGLSLIHI